MKNGEKLIFAMLFILIVGAYVGAEYVSPQVPDGYTKVLYDSETGKIFGVYKDTDWYYVNWMVDKGGDYWLLKGDGSVNVHLPLTLLNLEKSLENKNLTIYLLRNYKKTNETGLQSYYVNDDVLTKREGWEEYYPDFVLDGVD